MVRHDVRLLFDLSIRPIRMPGFQSYIVILQGCLVNAVRNTENVNSVCRTHLCQAHWHVLPYDISDVAGALPHLLFMLFGLKALRYDFRIEIFLFRDEFICVLFRL